VTSSSLLAGIRGLSITCSISFLFLEILSTRTRGNHDEHVHRGADHEFARSILLPEEDGRILSPIPWQGDYRWFRSPNVICLEKARRLKALGRI